MALKKCKKNKKACTRRAFLKTVSVSVPTLSLMLEETAPQAQEDIGSAAHTAAPKFTPIDLSNYVNSSPADFGPREEAKAITAGSSITADKGTAPDGLIRTPTGKQIFRGIPFLLGRGGVKEKAWVVLSTQESSSATRTLEIPLHLRAGFICLVGFCDWDGSAMPAPGNDVMERVGQHLADAILLYEDGSTGIIPIRRRFEVGPPAPFYGNLFNFAALPLRQDVPSKLTDPLSRGTDWGYLQYGALPGYYPGPREGAPVALISVCALANPEPERTVKTLRLQAAGDDPLVVCGLTLFHGRQSPLRRERLSLYRLTLPDATAEEQGRWNVDVDLGVVARRYVLGDFEAEAWLAATRKGLGDGSHTVRGARYLYIEMTASPNATVSLRDTKTGKQYEFDLNRLVPGQALEARPVGASIEALEREKVWLQGQVLDGTTGRPTPVRLSFRSKEGRYIPPYGHRTEINDGWFQDYGADLKLAETSFAYVDGSFQVELPLGDIYVEMTKGFEYEPIRRKLEIKAAQRELRIEIPRFVDLRTKGWVTADVHVHFLSPTTALLEGQAEGVNMVNLLAAQWGDLFTNVGDFSDVPLVSRDGDTVVWLGTENRQHLLGHINLLGGHGEPVYPLSASGPEPSYLGDPVWSSMADWADACRKREGLVVSPHFPFPTAEIAADIALGKIDAIEMYPWEITEHFNRFNYLEWYRYLNCGYRLPITGGTDKMVAFTPLGFNRTYAYLGAEEFNFANWAKAIRRGNTFQTTGPLLLFQADGHPPGDEIMLGTGGGTVEVQAEVKCMVPVHRLDIVMNGRVVASREERTGARELILKEKVQVSGPGWLAARCYSQERPIRILAIHAAISAHTSPVYVNVPGKELFSTSAAAYFLRLIEGSQTWLENLATRPDPEQLARVRKILADGHAVWHRKLLSQAARDAEC